MGIIIIEQSPKKFFSLEELFESMITPVRVILQHEMNKSIYGKLPFYCHVPSVCGNIVTRY